MLVYSAIDSATIKRIDNILIENNVKANNLISFIDTASIKKIDIIKQFSKNLLVDSGAFTIFNNPSKIKKTTMIMLRNISISLRKMMMML